MLAANEDERLVIADARAPYFGIQLQERTLLPQGEPSIAPTRLDDWLSRNARSFRVRPQSQLA